MVLQNRKVDVGADIEDADLERCVLVGIAKEGDDLLFLAGVERARVDFAAGLLDLLDQRFELGAVATPGEYREALGSKFLCDLAADIVTGADHGHGRVFLLQGSSPDQVISVVCEVGSPAPEALRRAGIPRAYA